MSVCGHAWFILRNMLMWLWEAGKSKTCRAVAQDSGLGAQAGFLFVFFFLWLCHAAWGSEYTGLPGNSLCFSLESEFFLWETSFSLLRSLTDWMGWGPPILWSVIFFYMLLKDFYLFLGFVPVRRLFLVLMRGSFSLRWFLLLQSRASRAYGLQWLWVLSCCTRAQ